MMDHGLSPGDFANMSFLLHTGGPKVLHHFMQVVTKVEDPDSDIVDGSLDPRVTHAMSTLGKYGNVASVSLLSTLQGRMADGLVNMDSQRCLVAGCGPGMGADWLLCNLVRHPAGELDISEKNALDCECCAKLGDIATAIEAKVMVEAGVIFKSAAPAS
jgi:predicted naringenin-chalcone synthase